MKPLRRLALALAFLLAACQPATADMITIMDGEDTYPVPFSSRLPAELFVRAGLILGPEDKALYNGTPVPLDVPLGASAAPVLQLLRSVTVTIDSPEGSRAIQTTASTVGLALQEAGLELSASDHIEPPPETPLTAPVHVTYRPSRLFEVQTAKGTSQMRSSAPSVGEALAEAGLALSGLDISRPGPEEPLPADGRIQVVRVNETLVLAQQPIPFENEFRQSDQVPLDQQQVLHPGQTGLTVSRVRIRYEDGQEVSRLTESETVVRPPENRVVGYGTKVEVTSASVDGVQIEYWRAVQMFATAYSPCRSSADRCYSSTASGKPVKKGVVALRTDLYMGMRGQPLFIPGYGFATVEDACGGCVGKPWIDLGYSDNDYQTWGSWVTVYFLTPVPSNIYYVLD